MTKVDFAGKHFYLDAAGGMDLVGHQVSAGAYEPPLPFLMMATYLRSEGIFVDVGANTGVYSVMAGILAEDRTVLAFEPLAALVAVLRRNLAANGLTDRVTVHELALSDVSGEATLHLPDPSHGLLETSASLEHDFKAVHGTVRVAVRTLDELDIRERIAVIKVDIEGHEHAFLGGARETIRRDRPFVFAEVVGPAKRGALRAFLADVNYLDFRLRPDLAIHDGEVVFDELAWNHAFVPAERLEKFKEACDSCGVVMVRRFRLT
ncbi:FkbM family methyltransferase [Methylobacterium sp. 4-46]|nr:FkbM family methyltransferase [Methylobacterium sp. 4-46]